MLRRCAWIGVFLLVAPLLARAATPKVSVVPAFPQLKFDKPVYLTGGHDGSNRIFVVEQDGRVLSFSNSPDVSTTTIALDIRSRVRREDMEEGLLGLAFHPNVKSNGRVFLQYSATPRRSITAGFRFNRDHTLINPDSEVVLLEVEKPYGNHNGGMIAFGPDGKLYIGLGDGGFHGDPHGNGQNKNVLLAKILRIDVDKTSLVHEYGIPSDNPFVGDPQARGEVWAFGMRNPWRFSFDRETGELWVGDVGQDAWEEVDIIEKGKNYGWNRKEGKHPFKPRDNDSFSDLTDPIWEIGRPEGKCVTGGYVYRGKKLPSLVGWYVYADFVTSRVWVLRRNGNQIENHQIAQAPLIASFGEDDQGEIYLVSYSGQIFKFSE